MSWDEVEDFVIKGKIRGLGADFDLVVFAAEVEDRLLKGIYELPTMKDVQKWMRQAI